MKQSEFELMLLNQLQGDREKFNRYIRILSTCTKPLDVADKVIKPMFLEGSVSEKEISTKAYYGTLASLVRQLNQHHIALKSIYYHINGKFSQWKKEKCEQDMQSDEAFREETRVIHHADGSLEIFQYIYLKETPDNVAAMIQPFIEQGLVEIKKKLQKNFNARGEEEVEIKCVAWLMQDVLQTLKENVVDTMVSIQSHYTWQEQITLDEALEIIIAESDEEPSDLR